MKKKLIIALAAALVLCCAGVGAWAASNAGTQSDPLVAMSYLEQVQQRLERNFEAWTPPRASLPPSASPAGA